MKYEGLYRYRASTERRNGRFQTTFELLLTLWTSRASKFVVPTLELATHTPRRLGSRFIHTFSGRTVVVAACFSIMPFGATRG